jgi:hypothetical protein
MNMEEKTMSENNEYSISYTISPEAETAEIPVFGSHRLAFKSQQAH